MAVSSSYLLLAHQDGSRLSCMAGQMQQRRRGTHKSSIAFEVGGKATHSVGFGDDAHLLTGLGEELGVDDVLGDVLRQLGQRDVLQMTKEVLHCRTRNCWPCVASPARRGQARSPALLSQ